MRQGDQVDISGSESSLGVRPRGLGARLEGAEKKTEDKKRKQLKCRLHFSSNSPPSTEGPQGLNVRKLRNGLLVRVHRGGPWSRGKETSQKTCLLQGEKQTVTEGAGGV